ncbi:MAG: flagellar biosynthetic protein FliR [Pseudomonadota bacterium]
MTSLPIQLAGFFLVFARIGAIVMLLPGFGDTAVPPRVRLLIAIALSLILFPVVTRHLPAIPGSASGLGALIVAEVLIGLLIGAIVKILFSALTVTGAIIGLQSGLAAANLFDPSQGQQSAILARFFGLAAIVLMFAAGLHHQIIEGLVRSYMMFIPGDGLMPEDFATLAVDAVATSFALGLQLAAPFLVYGIVFNVGLGLMARLTPTLQVFFVAQPLNLLLGFALMLALGGIILTQFIAAFGDMLGTIF